MFLGFESNAQHDDICEDRVSELINERFNEPTKDREG